MGNRITKNAVLGKAFGHTEEGLVDLPVKISGRVIARFYLYTQDSVGWCFPDRYHRRKPDSWKRYRNTQYRPTGIG